MNLLTLYSMAESSLPSVIDEKGYSYVWAVVITGLSVVFLGLIILILFVWLMGKIFSAVQNKNKPVKNVNVSEPKTATVVKPINKVQTVSKDSTVSTNDEDEIIAVISAAVAAMGQAEGKTYKLKSVKAMKNKKARSAWSMAGLQSDTSPF